VERQPVGASIMLNPNTLSKSLVGRTHGRFARISRPKLSGLGRHEGVLLPSGVVAHTTPNYGPHLCSLQQFSRTLPVIVEKELPAMQHMAAMGAVRDLLSNREPYHPWHSNCEIFARKALREPPGSPQAVGWACLALLGGFLYLNSQ
jgi:hypothetical protein